MKEELLQCYRGVKNSRCYPAVFVNIRCPVRKNRRLENVDVDQNGVSEKL